MGYDRHTKRETDITNAYYKLSDAYNSTGRKGGRIQGEEVHIFNSKDEVTKNLTNLRDELSKLRKLPDSEKLVTEIWPLTVEACNEIIGRVNQVLAGTRRRLAMCSLCSDHDAPSDVFAVAPFLLVLILMYFIFRRSAKAFNGT